MLMIRITCLADDGEPLGQPIEGPLDPMPRVVELDLFQIFREHPPTTHVRIEVYEES